MLKIDFLFRKFSSVCHSTVVATIFTTTTTTFTAGAVIVVVVGVSVWFLGKYLIVFCYYFMLVSGKVTKHQVICVSMCHPGRRYAATLLEILLLKRNFPTKFRLIHKSQKLINNWLSLSFNNVYVRHDMTAEKFISQAPKFEMENTFRQSE